MFLKLNGYLWLQVKKKQTLLVVKLMTNIDKKQQGGLAGIYEGNDS